MTTLNRGVQQGHPHKIKGKHVFHQIFRTKTPSRREYRRGQDLSCQIQRIVSRLRGSALAGPGAKQGCAALARAHGIAGPPHRSPFMTGTGIIEIAPHALTIAIALIAAS